ncbi:MAG: hypothetical protein LBM41_07550 [Ruminococcus sp.]|nr:hypothetical protein [Ruminococcus sp.]
MCNEEIEKLATAIYESYNKKQKLNTVSWADLPEETREFNRAQARAIKGKVFDAGFNIDGGESPFPAIEKFDDETTLFLAKKEHVRWMEELLSHGWTYAPVRDNVKKHHPCIVPFEELSDEEKQKDIDVIDNIIPLLKSIGLRVYRDFSYTCVLNGN